MISYENYFEKTTIVEINSENAMYLNVDRQVFREGPLEIVLEEGEISEVISDPETLSKLPQGGGVIVLADFTIERFNTINTHN